MVFSRKLLEIKQRVLQEARPLFQQIEETAESNTLKVLNAMREVRLSEAHFTTTSGYAYDDIGRQKLDELYAMVFDAEKALVRTQFVSGTHALATVLFGLLRPGDTLLSVTGVPYDTMQTVIGYAHPSPGSLKEFGISYDEVPLQDGRVDLTALSQKVTPKTKVALIQRSRGYSLRPPLTMENISQICRTIKAIQPHCVCFVDNCYGEFVNLAEPTTAGADIMAGSLIKNPGGGLAPVGGYIAGTKDCIENCAVRLSAPGLGKELGPSLGLNRAFFQGIFLAPSITASAEKAAIFAASLYERLGFPCHPRADSGRNDIIQAIRLGSPEAVLAFCQGIQAASPVDSFVMPEPWEMPGYDAPVIMAAGAFIQGSSIELSADAPMKEPYNVYFQGGLTWPHAKFGIILSVQKLWEKGLVKL